MSTTKIIGILLIAAGVLGLIYGVRVLRQCLIGPAVHADGKSVHICCSLLLAVFQLVPDISTACSTSDGRNGSACSAPYLVAKHTPDYGAGDGAYANAAATNASVAGVALLHEVNGLHHAISRVSVS